MPAAALPLDEEDRLQSLCRSGLVEGYTDRRIKLLVRLATTILNRPSAAVTLITAERQLAKAGINYPALDMPRAYSFCSHAILQADRPLVVEDAALDPRFADNPFVGLEKDPLRFYAGVPLRLPGGQPIGALSVLDHVPGSMKPKEVEILCAMGAQVEEVIAHQKASSAHRPTLLHDLRRDMHRGGLFLQWQPIWSAWTTRIIGHEALVRWMRSDGSISMPDSFIPAAAESAFITNIDRHVLTAACAEAALADDDGLISVNISGRWFGTSGAGLVEEVEEACYRTGLEPSRLTLEITEDVPIRDPNRAIRELRMIKALGVKLALDDFGTAYSSLSHLEKLPFDIVKLDKAFVSAIGNSERAEAVIHAVIRLAHRLGMTACAEGVETEDQLAFLQDAGADLIQGYLIGRPGPRAAI